MYMHKNSISEYLISVLFAVTAVLIIVATVMHIIGVQSASPMIALMVQGGGFLFVSFHLGAFIIGVYFLIAAGLVLIERSSLPLFVELMLLSLPILSFSLGMRILFSSSGIGSPIVQWTIQAFGRRGSILVSFLLTAALFILIFQLRDRLARRNFSAPGGAGHVLDPVHTGTSQLHALERKLTQAGRRFTRVKNNTEGGATVHYRGNAPLIQVNNTSAFPQAQPQRPPVQRQPVQQPVQQAEQPQSAPPSPPPADEPREQHPPAPAPVQSTPEQQQDAGNTAQLENAPPLPTVPFAADTAAADVPENTAPEDAPATETSAPFGKIDTRTGTEDTLQKKVYGQYDEDLPPALFHDSEYSDPRYLHQGEKTETAAAAAAVLRGEIEEGDALAVGDISDRDILVEAQAPPGATLPRADKMHSATEIAREMARVTASTAKNYEAPASRRADAENTVQMPRFVISDGAIYSDQQESSHDVQSAPPDSLPEPSDPLSEPLAPSTIPPLAVIPSEWYLDPIALLHHYPHSSNSEIDKSSRQTAHRLQVTLQEFKIQAEIVGIRRGPVVTTYELLPAKGVKVASISRLADNIALRLAAERVRIVAPIPGKQAVGIELPNRDRQIVGFDRLVTDEQFTDRDIQLPIALGRGISGEAEVFDLTKTPHLLIAGATGSGKSVCVNSIICSLMFRCSPYDVRMVLIDPKIVELKIYNDIPHLITPVITDPQRAVTALNYCVTEMERRYHLLDTCGARDIKSYNQIVDADGRRDEHLPYLVVVIDEFADLMMTGGKQIEFVLSRLAAMARAVGIHLVLATQRPSADVITGLIKANIPTRIAFMVSSKVDSRIILDVAGAEQLLGRGDMLFVSSWDPNPIRVQGALVTEKEVGKIAAAAREFSPPNYIPEEELFGTSTEEGGGSIDGDDDPLYQEALDVVLSSGKASASFLQRRLQIGYNRAARLIEEMEKRGVVGPPNGSKPRELVAARELM